MACDPATLLGQAQCFQCLPPGQLALVELALLCQIMQNGGGGGGALQVKSGAGDPVAAPTNTLIDNVYYDTAAVPINTWLWPAGGAAWQQV